MCAQCISHVLIIVPRYVSSLPVMTSSWSIVNSTVGIIRRVRHITMMSRNSSRPTLPTEIITILVSHLKSFLFISFLIFSISFVSDHFYFHAATAPILCCLTTTARQRKTAMLNNMQQLLSTLDVANVVSEVKSINTFLGILRRHFRVLSAGLAAIIQRSTKR